MSLERALSNFHVVGATYTKSGLHAGNMQLNTQNEECLSMYVIISITLPVWFSVQHMQ